MGLGTNVGDRFHNFVRALVALQRIGQLRALSRIYASAPVGYQAQPEFWNAVAVLQTRLSPLQLFTAAKAIERELGRASTFPGGPRVIDLDVLLYDDDVIESDILVVPHPRMHERAFVLRPLAELAPARMHPRLGRRIDDLLDDVREQHAVPLERESGELLEEVTR